MLARWWSVHLDLMDRMSIHLLILADRIQFAEPSAHIGRPRLLHNSIPTTSLTRHFGHETVHFWHIQPRLIILACLSQWDDMKRATQLSSNWNIYKNIMQIQAVPESLRLSPLKMLLNQRSACRMWRNVAFHGCLSLVSGAGNFHKSVLEAGRTKPGRWWREPSFDGKIGLEYGYFSQIEDITKSLLYMKREENVITKYLFVRLCVVWTTHLHPLSPWLTVLHNTCTSTPRCKHNTPISTYCARSHTFRVELGRWKAIIDCWAYLGANHG